MTAFVSFPTAKNLDMLQDPEEMVVPTKPSSLSDLTFGNCCATVLRRSVCSLLESMWITPTRHPFKMKFKLGANRDGRLTAYRMDFTLDNGAYTSLGKAIVNRGLFMLSGSYNIPAVEALGRLVYTNDAWGGAARGAGPPQVNFAQESAMELMAQRLKMNSLEFRLINSVKPGEFISTGQVVEEWPYSGCLEALRSHYERACREAAALRRDRMSLGLSWH